MKANSRAQEIFPPSVLTRDDLPLATQLPECPPEKSSLQSVNSLLYDSPLGSRVKHCYLCLILGQCQRLLLCVGQVGCLLCLHGNLRPATEQDLWTRGFSKKSQSILEGTVQTKITFWVCGAKKPKGWYSE